jgi:P-type Mg2+ transporter
VESVVSAALIVLVVRTRRPFFLSRPSGALLAATIAVVAGTVLLPLTPFGAALGFVHLPGLFFLLLGILVCAYMATAELAKRRFYRINGNRGDS